MLNYIWAILLTCALIANLINGKIDNILPTITYSSKEAIEIILSILGLNMFWSGIMQIAHDSGLIQKISKKIAIILNFLFREPPKKSETMENIAITLISSCLGIGAAATTFGIKAMQGLQKNNTSNRATDDMCMLVTIIASNIQLIPITTIALLTKFNHNNPSIIILPSLLASLVSTTVGIIICLIFRKKKCTV